MSMTTELVQRMKAAALNAKHAGEAPIMHFDERISALKEFQLTACPANVVDLVEALEARDKQIAELSGIISLARKFASKCAGFGDVGAAEFIKIIDRATGVAVEGE